MTADEQAITVPFGSHVVFAWTGHHNTAEVDTLAEYGPFGILHAVALSEEHSSHGHSHRKLATGTYTMQIGSGVGKR
jgi:hypothetical protein